MKYMISRLTECVGCIGRFQVLDLLERLEALHKKMFQALSRFAGWYLRKID